MTRVERHLLLFGTCGCHLCELAEQELMPWVAAGWQVELIDIADDERWMASYASVIPVLQHAPSSRELRWPFDQAALAGFLESCRVSG